jgi:hypothetical protein|tara:strand:+ start:398 stop:580 length:183 start_codon:yes stop_codon:yes gene_type:complete
MTRYVHDYTISFCIHTTEPDPYKVSGQDLRDALISAHSTLNNEEIVEMVDHLNTISEKGE